MQSILKEILDNILILFFEIIITIILLIKKNKNK
jgi:hypothetical protein